jgi:hypothetical protein
MLHCSGHGQEVAAYSAWELLAVTAKEGSGGGGEGGGGLKAALLGSGVLEGLRAVVEGGSATANARTSAAGALKELTGGDALADTVALLAG